MKNKLATYLAVSFCVVSFTLAGCKNNADQETKTFDEAAPEDVTMDEHEHDHPSEGPHHGSLIELGKEAYHAELVHDEKTAPRAGGPLVDSTPKPDCTTSRN